MRRATMRLLTRAAVTAAALLVGATDCRAQATNMSLFWTNYYTQDSPSTPTTPSSYGFDARLFYTTAGDYATATLSGPGTVASLPLTDFPAFTVFDSANQIFTTQADRDAAYPNGLYSIATTGGSPDVVVNATKTLDAYSLTVPALTASTYTALQGLDTTQGFTFNLSPYTPSPDANEADLFLNVFDNLGNAVFSAGFLPPTMTSIFMAANTLMAGTDYTFDIVYSDRINGTDDSSGVGTALGFDSRTDGTFTTAAVPEPASLALLGLGGLAALAARRGRRARSPLERALRRLRELDRPVLPDREDISRRNDRLGRARLAGQDVGDVGVLGAVGQEMSVRARPPLLRSDLDDGPVEQPLLDDRPVRGRRGSGRRRRAARRPASSGRGRGRPRARRPRPAARPRCRAGVRGPS